MLEIVSYFMSYIIEQVKRRRQERNWSQKYIADCINVSQSFIYKAVIYIFTIGRLSDPKKSTRREHRFYKLYGLYKLYNSKAPCLFGSFS